MKKIIIDEGEDHLQVFIDGRVFASYHGVGLEFLRKFARDDLVVWILTHGDNPMGDFICLRLLVEQLREEGYFHVG